MKISMGANRVAKWVEANFVWFLLWAIVLAIVWVVVFADGVDAILKKFGIK